MADHVGTLINMHSKARMNFVSPRPSGLLSIESMMKCGGSEMVFISMPQRMGEKNLAYHGES